MARGVKDSIEQDQMIRLRMSAELYKQAQALAKARGTNFSQLVRDLLTEAIEAAAKK